MLAAEAVPAAPIHVQEPTPWYVDLLIEWGGWAVLALAVVLFSKYGVPKIVAAIRGAFAAQQKAHKEQTDALLATNERQRQDFLKTVDLNREAQKEATLAGHQTAMSMAALSASMDSFRDELKDLPARIERATQRGKAPVTDDEVTAAKKKANGSLEVVD